MKATFTSLALFLTLMVHGQMFDIQGHRGCRGLMPENSIPGFLKAIDLGVTTIEMDVVVSADGKTVVSHDPYISSKFCVNELGMPIAKKKEKDINIFRMLYENVRLFDCGITGNKDFPGQEKVSVYKPLLIEAIQACEQHVKASGKTEIRYNIEIKSAPSGDNVFHPAPELYTRLVHEALRDIVPPERVVIQSFDVRILQFWKMRYPEYKISYLLSGAKSSKKVIDELGFTPDVFSPYYKKVNKRIVDDWHKLSVRVIPWTVNNVSDMKKLIAMGVDGLITDYPDRYFNSVESK